MKDLVRIQDYIRYLQLQVSSYEQKSIKAKEDYHRCKGGYENKFLPKLLGWKYEDSFEGDTSWTGSWNFYEDNISAWKSELQRCTYMKKIGHTFISIGDGFSEKSFYKWCDENNIPQ